jgi:3-hydroxymyristoyl/3-hydroxydecanoyl-(acyl carrier protein) dehydratase
MTGFVIPPDHPCLEGHFPGRPIVPGVLLLDHIAQALGIRPAGFANIRFTRPVRPGDHVDIAIDADRFTARVGSDIVVQGTVQPR